jgi:hypothetical protein
VVSAKEHQEDANSRRQKEKPVLGKCVRIQQASTIANTNLVLCGLIVPIKRRQINI